MKEAGEAGAEAKMADAKSGTHDHTAKTAKVAKAKKGKGAAFTALAATVDENKMAFTTVASVGVLAVVAALFTLKRQQRVVVKSATRAVAVETTPMLV